MSVKYYFVPHIIKSSVNALIIKSTIEETKIWKNWKSFMKSEQNLQQGCHLTWLNFSCIYIFPDQLLKQKKWNET